MAKWAIYRIYQCLRASNVAGFATTEFIYQLPLQYCIIQILGIYWYAFPQRSSTKALIDPSAPFSPQILGTAQTCYYRLIHE